MKKLSLVLILFFTFSLSFAFQSVVKESIEITICDPCQKCGEEKCECPKEEKKAGSEAEKKDCCKKGGEQKSADAKKSSPKEEDKACCKKDGEKKSCDKKKVEE